VYKKASLLGIEYTGGAGLRPYQARRMPCMFMESVWKGC